MEEEHIAFSALREINCTVHWFQNWTSRQKQIFLKDLVTKALPNKVDLLLDAMGGMNMVDQPPNIFECQMRLFGQWFEEWTIQQRNFFIEKLQSFDPTFVEQFYSCVRQSVVSSS